MSCPSPAHPQQSSFKFTDEELASLIRIKFKDFQDVMQEANSRGIVISITGNMRWNPGGVQILKITKTHTVEL